MTQKDEVLDSTETAERSFKWTWRPVYTALKCCGLYNDLIARYKRKESKIISPTNLVHLFYCMLLSLLLIINTAKFAYEVHLNRTNGISTALASSVANLMIQSSFTLYLPMSLWKLSSHLDPMLKEMQRFKDNNGKYFNMTSCRNTIAVLLVVFVLLSFLPSCALTVSSRSSNSANDTAVLFSSTSMFGISKMPPAVALSWFHIVSFLNSSILAVIGLLYVFAIFFLRGCAAFLADDIKEKTSRNINNKTLKDCRTKFQTLVEMVECFDSCVCHVAGATYTLALTVPCLMLYGLVHDQLSEGELTFAVSYIVHVGQQIVCYVTGAIILNNAIHKPLPDLYNLNTDELTATGMQELSLFVSRLSGAPIGVSVFGWFVIDKSTVLMLIGTVVTYAVVVIQLQPNTDTCNCNG